MVRSVPLRGQAGPRLSIYAGQGGVGGSSQKRGSRSRPFGCRWRCPSGAHSGCRAFTEVVMQQLLRVRARARGLAGDAPACFGLLYSLPKQRVCKEALYLHALPGLILCVRPDRMFASKFPSRVGELFVRSCCGGHRGCGGGCAVRFTSAALNRSTTVAATPATPVHARPHSPRALSRRPRQLQPLPALGS